jgi:hypothetical protein
VVLYAVAGTPQEDDIEVGAFELAPIANSGQPDLSQVEVPTARHIEAVVADWTRASRRWQKKFNEAADKVLVGLDDPRTRISIEQRAMRLLHAI